MNNNLDPSEDRLTEQEITSALDHLATQPLSRQQRSFLEATRAAYEKKLAQLKAEESDAPARAD